MKKVTYTAETFKGSKIVKALEYLEKGGNDKAIIDDAIFSALDYIDHKYDCCDFRISVLVRILYRYSDRLSENTRKSILKTIAKYPYSDRYSTSICSWSENHRICINSSGYLIGQLDRSLQEVNSNKNLFALCKEQLMLIGKDILHNGIKEFSSNTYYPVSMASIGNIIEFAQDEDLVKLYTCVLDLYVFDTLSLSMYNNVYNVANARSYIDNKTSTTNHMSSIIRILKGEHITELSEDESCFICFMNTGKYKVPQVFLDINALKERELTFSNSQDIEMLIDKGYLNYDEDKVRLLMQQGLFSDYRFIDNTVKYIKSHEMEMHPLFKYMRRYIASKKASVSAMKKRHKIYGDNSYIGKGNTYTYIKGNYQLSHLNNYHIDMGASQQSTNMINIDNLSSFTLVPYKNKKKMGGRNYWTGGLRNAHWSGERNLLMGIYDLKGKKHYSHLYFPTEMLDEYNADHIKNGYLFGRYHGTNIMIKANKLEIVDSTKDNAIKVKGKMDNFVLKKYDFKNTGAFNHYYIYKLDNALSFAEFIKRELAVPIHFKKKTLSYGNYTLVHGDALYCDGVNIEKEYKYLTNDFCTLKKGVVCFKLNNRSLKINLETCGREENE